MIERNESIIHLEPYLHVSEALHGNPMGNSPRRSCWILHPYGRKEAELVFYVLDGYFGNGHTLIADPGPMGTPIINEFLTLQEDTILPPSLFVFVDGSTLLGGSQYMNSESCGAFGDYCAIELPKMIDETYRTKGCKRVLMGHSSGGYGALRLPMDYPEVFHGSIVSAADSLFDMSLRSQLISACIQINKSGGINPFLDSFQSRALPERCSYPDFQAIMILAMASCYSPAPFKNAAHCQLPFDLETLEFDHHLWAEWMKHDPVTFTNQRLGHLASLEYLHFDCGRYDEFGAQFGHRQISRRLQQLGIDHIHEEFDGTHSGTRFRMRHRLSLLGSKLGKKRPPSL